MDRLASHGRVTQRATEALRGPREHRTGGHNRNSHHFRLGTADRLDENRFEIDIVFAIHIDRTYYRELSVYLFPPIANRSQRAFPVVEKQSGINLKDLE